MHDTRHCRRNEAISSRWIVVECGQLGVAGCQENPCDFRFAYGHYEPGAKCWRRQLKKCRMSADLDCISRAKVRYVHTYLINPKIVNSNCFIDQLSMFIIITPQSSAWGYIVFMYCIWQVEEINCQWIRFDFAGPGVRNLNLMNYKMPYRSHLATVADCTLPIPIPIPISSHAIPYHPTWSDSIPDADANAMLLPIAIRSRIVPSWTRV